MESMPTTHATKSQFRPRPVPAHTSFSRTLTPSRPGALWRMANGESFRFSKDATRIHYAGGHKHNVVYFTSETQPGARLPDHLLRALLTRFADARPWAQAHRNWRAHQDLDGRWSLALELRGGAQNRLRFPAPTAQAGAAARFTDEAEFHALVNDLWSQADKYEENVDAPADLDLLRRQIAAQSAVG